jgi:hypothetical protein
MLMALGAVSTALDVLQSLTSSKPSSPQSTGFGQSTKNPFDFPASGPASGSSPPPPRSGGKSQLSPATMGALLAAQNESSMGSATSALASQPNALKDLFSQLADSDGNISTSAFETAFGAGGTNLTQADDVFGRLDQDASGTVSLDEMSAALKGRGHHRYHHAGNSTEAQAIASPAPASVSVTV